MKLRALSPGVALALPLALPLTLLAAGCDDPVHDDEVAALGPESPDVPPGPLHRPGQPCLVCHDGSGPGVMVFASAGTVFQDETTEAPLVAATVQLTDINDLILTPETNCAGNFFVQAVDWNLIYPVHTQVCYGGCNNPLNPAMVSHIAKTDSCATCHTGTAPTQSSVSQVYYSQTPMAFPPSGCPQ